MLTLTNRIDMRPGAVPLVIHLGQYDSDFSLVFELYSSAGNFTVESGTTAMIRGTKTDGHAYDADTTIDISAKTVTVAGSEQMTAAKGRNVYELVLTKSGKVLSTANFILDVERAAMDADTITSESVLKELNAIIDSAATSTQAAADAASAADRAEDAAESVSSASAQIATNTADIADLKADFEQLEPGLSDGAKVALLNCFQHVAFLDDDADYYGALESALYADQYPKITALFNPGLNVIYTADTLDSLKQYLTVKYFETEESSGTVIASANYSLSGMLVEGTSTVFVSYSGLTTSFVINGVVDFYNIWDWSLLNGDFTKLVASTDRDSSALTGIYISLAETRPAVQYRRNISVPRGIIPFTDYVSHELSTWYPIPVPKTANKITVAVTPNTQYSFINLVKYKSEQNKYDGAAENIGGWTQGNNVKTFTASENLFVSINFKYDSAGQSYPTEPSNITVKFEEV